MVIKFTVCQTSGSFPCLWADDVFYSWHVVLVNVINCIHTCKCTNTAFTRKRVQKIHTEQNKYKYEWIRVEKYEEKLHYFFLHLSGIDHMLL